MGRALHNRLIKGIYPLFLWGQWFGDSGNHLRSEQSEATGLLGTGPLNDGQPWRYLVWNVFMSRGLGWGKNGVEGRQQEGWSSRRGFNMCKG